MLARASHHSTASTRLPSATVNLGAGFGLGSIHRHPSQAPGPKFALAGPLATPNVVQNGAVEPPLTPKRQFPTLASCGEAKGF